MDWMELFVNLVVGVSGGAVLTFVFYFIRGMRSALREGLERRGPDDES